MIKKGFYYHYKHNKDGQINDYAYEVIGTGKNTEDLSCVVIYRPLYKTSFIDDNDYYVRPYEMFMGKVELAGQSINRFDLITDKEIIIKLNNICIEMYKK